MPKIVRKLGRAMGGWLDRLTEPAEDPRKVFGGTHGRHLDLAKKIAAARDEVDKSRADLEARAAGVRDEIGRLTALARTGVLSGDDEGARFSLRSKLAAEQTLPILQDQVRQLGEEAQRLHAAEMQVAAEVETYQARWEAAEARLSTSSAQVSARELLAGVSDGQDRLPNREGDLETVEDRAHYQESRAQAIDELSSTGVLESIGSGPLGAGSGGESPGLDGEVERRLEELKAELS
jgi:phage shock protein A